MKNLLKISIALFVAVTVSACGTKNEKTVRDGKPDGDSNEKRTIVAEANMDAETLALAGEQLVNPATFMLAEKTFEMALSKDPENKRAQFYQSFLKRVGTLKGIGARIRPWVRANGDIGTLESEAGKFPNSPLKDFLYTGAEDIRTTTQVQDLLVQYRNALIEYYNWLKKNQDLALTLNLNPFVFQEQFRQEALDHCDVIDNGYGRVEVQCDYREIAQRRVNSADMIAIRQYVAGEILYFSIYTSYSAEGAEQLIRQNRKGNMSGPQVIAFLNRAPEFGRLRKDHSLSILTTLGADLVSAWKWVMENQNHLCPSGKYESEVVHGVVRPVKNRKGQLLDTGICVKVDSEAQKSAALLERAISGAVTVEVAPPNTDTKKNVVVDPFALSRKPVENLKDVFPVSFNKCGKVSGLKDKTLGGVYPQGNAEEMIDSRCLLD